MQKVKYKMKTDLLKQWCENNIKKEYTALHELERNYLDLNNKGLKSIYDRMLHTRRRIIRIWERVIEVEKGRKK